VEGAARLRFAALRAGVEFFDHAAKSAIKRRYVIGMRLFGPYQRDDSSGRRSRGKSLGWFQPFPTILTKRNVLPAVSQRHQTHITSLRNSSIEGIKGGPNCAVGWGIHLKTWLHPGFVDSPRDFLHKRIV